MDIILSLHSVDMSDLREAPARAFEQAGDEAVVVFDPNARLATSVKFRLFINTFKKSSGAFFLQS